jgi:hypothetical protein
LKRRSAFWPDLNIARSIARDRPLLAVKLSGERLNELQLLFVAGCGTGMMTKVL